MDERIAKELRNAIERHSESPELHELWLRVLGLQLLAEDLAQKAKGQIERMQTYDSGSNDSDRDR